MDRTHQPLATVFGASGFVGTQITQLLARANYRIRAAVRRPDLAGHLRPLGDVGQIAAIQANLRDAPSVMRAVAGADLVINLVGIGYERGRQRFDTIHVEGARNVAQAARAVGATALVHMSILGADPESESPLVRSRAAGEAAALEAFPQAVVMRPSIMFGQGDGFFNLMAAMARLSPVLPLIGGNTRLQPVYVGDVADAFLKAAEGGVKTGRIYELGGPEIVTHKELLQRILRETGRSNPLVPLPSGVAKLLALPFKLLPYPPLLTADQVIQLAADNVVSDAAIKEKRTLAAFGITPTPMTAILPTYLWRFRKNGQFDRQTA
jgi:NADH dehydrogenase